MGRAFCILSSHPGRRPDATCDHNPIWLVKRRHNLIKDSPQRKVPVLPASYICTFRLYPDYSLLYRTFSYNCPLVPKSLTIYLMFTNNCCSFQRSFSPDLPNSKIIQALQESDNCPLHQLDPIAFVTPVSTMGSTQSREVRAIFASSQDHNAKGSSSSAARRKSLRRELPAIVRHKESSGRLSYLTERLKRKMSLDSGLSRKSSKMRLKNSLSEEDIQRRQELKRALHQRLQEDLLRDRSASEGGYDEDAMPIATPYLTLDRNGSFGHINPEDITAVHRPPDALQSSDRKFGGQSRGEKYSAKVTTVQDGSTIRKVLRKKKSAPATLLAEQHPSQTAIEPNIRIASGQSASPFHFNNLVIHRRSRLSLRKAPVERPDTAKGKPDTLRSGLRVKRASGIFGRSTPNMRLHFGYTGKPSRQKSHRANCDPAIGELGLGGIDGAADTRNAVTAPTEQISIRHQEPQATQHLASRSVRVSQSLSQIGESSGQWHMRRTSSVYSRQLNLHRSSSQYSTRSSILPEVGIRTAVEVQGKKTTTRQPLNRSRDDRLWRQQPQHIASSVYSSHGGSRQSIPNLDGTLEPYPSVRRQSTAYDLFSVENKEAASLWEKAFQGHIEEDAAIKMGRRSSMLPRRKCGVAIRRVASVSQETSCANPKRGVPEGRRDIFTRPSLRRLQKYSSASSLRRLSPSNRGREPTDHTNKARRRGRNSSPARSAGSWSRFPSHTRAERSSSPASSSDGVHSRDFAIETTRPKNPSNNRFGTFPAMEKRKSRSLTFRKSITNTLGRLYRSQVELRGFDRGHRSSISAGGMLEYPELEIPAGLGEGGATVWSQIYEDCIPPRNGIDDSSVADLDLASPIRRPNISYEAVGRTRMSSRA